jgi:nitrite reductase/ring-hydroxylating ferredoxin subunit
MAVRERLICASDALADSGEGVRFEVHQGEQTVSAFIVRYEGQVHAYLNRCAHMPMELDWKPGLFFDDEGLLLVCSTHGAVYAPDTGACLGGPCAGALARLEVEERGGGVYLKG